MGGGAEWGGNAIDPDGTLYQNANEMVWDLKLIQQTTGNKNGLNRKSLYQTTVHRATVLNVREVWMASFHGL
jgi:quinoprotein glucose dehydrogenase